VCFFIFFFFFQAEDGIRDDLVTGVQTCALPILRKLVGLGVSRSVVGLVFPTGYVFNTDGTNIYLTLSALFLAQATATHLSFDQRSEERRVGKECRSRRSAWSSRKRRGKIWSVPH